jgi:dipeptidase E
MKIILASKEKFLLDKGYDVLGISRESLKIAFIDTAFKAVADQEYIEYMKEYNELMALSGIDFQTFDIEHKTEKEIKDFLADRNVIQVCGGNPFYLLKAVRETNFEIILKTFLEQGGSYIGCSSGSYLMCPTVEVAGWKLSRNRYGVEDFSALHYVPFLIKCHYEDPMREDIIEKMKSLKYPLKVLKDDQCFLVEDGRVEFFGNSTEVFL